MIVVQHCSSKCFSVSPFQLVTHCLLPGGPTVFKKALGPRRKKKVSKPCPFYCEPPLPARRCVKARSSTPLEHDRMRAPVFIQGINPPSNAFSDSRGVGALRLKRWPFVWGNNQVHSVYFESGNKTWFPEAPWNIKFFQIYILGK